MHIHSEIIRHPQRFLIFYSFCMMLSIFEIPTAKANQGWACTVHSNGAVSDPCYCDNTEYTCCDDNNICRPGCRANAGRDRRICTPCPANHYTGSSYSTMMVGGERNGFEIAIRNCVACTHCTSANEYKAGCSGGSEGYCTTCDTCGRGKYKINCAGFSIGSCSDCVACTGNYYRTGCGGLSDGSCTACAINCGNNKYNSGCGGFDTGTCTDCVACTGNSYRTGCSGLSEGSCTACATNCGKDKYNSGCGGLIPGTCTDCRTDCGTGTYLYGCGGLDAGTCTNCQPCGRGAYMAGCEALSDGTCTVCPSDTWKLNHFFENNGQWNDECQDCPEHSQSYYQSPSLANNHVNIWVHQCLCKAGYGGLINSATSTCALCALGKYKASLSSWSYHLNERGFWAKLSADYTEDQYNYACVNMNGCQKGQSRFNHASSTPAFSWLSTCIGLSSTDSDGEAVKTGCKSAGQCLNCPDNYYQDVDGSNNAGEYTRKCTECPANSITWWHGDGADEINHNQLNTHQSACVCIPGYQSKLNSAGVHDFSACEMCPVGQYKKFRSNWKHWTASQEGQTNHQCSFIKGCVKGKSRYDHGFNNGEGEYTWKQTCNNANECTMHCHDHIQDKGCKTTGSCKNCPTNYYQGVDGSSEASEYNTTCTVCPDNSQSWYQGVDITNTQLNTDISACVCIAGYQSKRNSDDEHDFSACERCPVGKYKDSRSTWDTTTQDTQNKHQCLDIKGCEVGRSKYDYTDGTGEFTWRGSCDQEDKMCTSEGSCVNCPTDYYQDIDGTDMFAEYDRNCTVCPDNSQSWYQGSDITDSQLNTDISACVCNEGYQSKLNSDDEHDFSACEMCSAGKYKDSRSTWNTTTQDTQHQHQCVDIKGCEVGRSKYDYTDGTGEFTWRGSCDQEDKMCTSEGSCVNCPTDYYQDIDGTDMFAEYNRNCTKCPDNSQSWYRNNNISFQEPKQLNTHASACVCNMGYRSVLTDDVNDFSECEKCPVGKYKTSRSVWLTVDGGTTQETQRCDFCENYEVITVEGAYLQTGQIGVLRVNATTSLETFDHDTDLQNPDLQKVSCMACGPGFIGNAQTGASLCDRCVPGKFAEKTGTHDIDYREQCSFCTNYRVFTGDRDPDPIREHEKFEGHVRVRVLYADSASDDEKQSLQNLNSTMRQAVEDNHISIWYGSVTADDEGVTLTLLLTHDSSATDVDDNKRIEIKSTLEDAIAQKGLNHGNITVEVDMLDNDQDQIGCRSCKSGYVGSNSVDQAYTGEGGTQCQHCVAGKFANRKGAELNLKRGIGYNETCDDCPLGTFSFVLEEAGCRICNPGYRTLNATGSADCIACPAGKKSTDTPSHQCESCPAGKFSVLASHQCFDCPAGKYSDSENSLWCELCEAGKYSVAATRNQSMVETGASFSNLRIPSDGPRKYCESCEAGKRSTIPPSDECHDCAAGKYSTQGLELCADCQAGKMSGPGKGNACENCAVGKYVDFVRATVCYECVAGKFQDGEGSTTCEFCDSGLFMRETESPGAVTTCSTCPGGTYMEMINFTHSQSDDFSESEQDYSSAILNTFKQKFTLDQEHPGTTQFIRVKMNRERYYAGTKMMYVASTQIMKVETGGVKIKQMCLQHGHEANCDSDTEVTLNTCALDASEAYHPELFMSTQYTDDAECMRPNTQKECQLAIDREYTFVNETDDLSPPDALSGCYCYKTGTKRHECYFKHFDSYNSDHDDSVYDTASGQITRPCLNKKSLATTTSIRIYSRDPANAWQNLDAMQYLNDDQLKKFLDETSPDGQTFTQDCQQKNELQCKQDSHDLDVNCENREFCALRRQNAWGKIDGNWMFIGNDADTNDFGDTQTSAPDDAVKYYFYELSDVPVRETDTALNRTCQPYSLQACVASMAEKTISSLELTNDALGCRCSSHDCKYGVETSEGTFIQQTIFENGYTAPQGHDCHRIPVCRDVANMLVPQKPPENELGASDDDIFFIVQFEKTQGVNAWPEVQVEIEIAPYTYTEHEDLFGLEQTITRAYHPSCLVCQEGTYFDSESSTGPNKATDVGGNGDLCSKCVAGKIIAVGDTGDAVAYPWDHDSEDDCVLCVDGKFQESTGQTKCDECPAGSMQRDLSVSGKSSKNKCLACPPGMYQDEPGEISCKFCPAGKHTQSVYILSDIYDGSEQSVLWNQVSSDSRCVDCPSGKYRTHGQTNECSPCPPGSYVEGTGSVKCDLCPEGKYSRLTQQFSPDSCTECGEGKFANRDRSGCSMCEPGQYNVFGICVACAPGLYLNEVTETCEKCLEGKHAPVSGLTSCLQCDAGKYSITQGSVECLSCDRGQQHSPDYTGCGECKAGKYNKYPGQACSQCDTGKYNAEIGAYDCRPCVPGTYSDLPGALSCKVCPRGKFQSSHGQSGCEDSCDGVGEVALSWACLEYNEAECSDDEYKTNFLEECALRPEELIQRSCTPFYNHTWDLQTDLCATEEKQGTFLTNPAYMPLKWAHYPLRGVQDGVIPEPRFGVATSHTMGHKFRLVSWGVNSVDLFFVNSTNQLPELEDGSRKLSFVRIYQDTLNLAGKNIINVSFSAADRYLKIRLQPLGIMIFTVGDEPALYFEHENATDAVFNPSDEQLFLILDEKLYRRFGDRFENKVQIMVGGGCSVQSMKGVLPFNLQFQVHVQARCGNDELKTKVIRYDKSTGYMWYPNHEPQADAKGNFEIIEVFNSSKNVEFQHSDTSRHIVDEIYEELPMPSEIYLKPKTITKTIPEEMLTSQKAMLNAMFKTEYLSTKVQRLDELGMLLMFSRNESMIFAIKDGELDASWVFNVDGEASEFVISIDLRGNSLFLHTSFGIYVVNAQTGEPQSRFQINGAQFYEMHFVSDHVLLHWKCGDGSFVSNEAQRACYAACPEGLICDASCDANYFASLAAVTSHDLDGGVVIGTTDHTCSETCRRNQRLCVHSKLRSEQEALFDFEDVEKDGSGCQDDPLSDDSSKVRDCFCDGETFVRETVQYEKTEFAMKRGGGFSLVSKFRLNNEDSASILKLEGDDHFIHLHAQATENNAQAILQFKHDTESCDVAIEGLKSSHWYVVVASVVFHGEEKVRRFFLQDSTGQPYESIHGDDCSVVLASFDENIALQATIGSDTGNINIAGLYSFDRHLTETATSKILQTIEIGARDDTGSLGMQCEKCPPSQISMPNSFGSASCSCRGGEYGQCVNVTGVLKVFDSGEWLKVSEDLIECPGGIFTLQSNVCEDGKHISDYGLFNGNCFGVGDEVIVDGDGQKHRTGTVKQVLKKDEYMIEQDGDETEISSEKMGYPIHDVNQLRQFLFTSFITRTDFICKPGPYDNTVRVGSVSEDGILAPCNDNEYLNFVASSKKTCEIHTGYPFSASRDTNLFARKCADKGEYCFCHGSIEYQTSAGKNEITSNSGVLKCSEADLPQYTNGPCECVGHLSGCLCTVDEDRCSFREGTEQETELTYEMQGRYFQPTIAPTCTSCPEDKISAPGSIGLDACACGQGKYYGSASDKFRQLDRPSAYDIDGGGWELVRRVKAGSHWHPVTDKFAGVEEYGNYSDDETSDQTFSKRFDALTTDDDTEILLATGDAQFWLITRVRYLRQPTNNSENVAAIRTRFDPKWHTVKWDSRVGYGEDQWISMQDMDLIDLKNACYQRSDKSYRCPVTASSQSDHSEQSPNLATDDDEATFWEGAMNRDQWLRVDMEYPYFVKRVYVTMPSNLQGSLKFYVGDYEDATDWDSGKTCTIRNEDNTLQEDIFEFEYHCDLRGRYAYLFFHEDDAQNTKKIYEVKILGYDANNDTASDNYTHPHILYGDHGSHDHIDLVQKHTGANVFVRNPKRSCISDLEQVQEFAPNKKSSCGTGMYADSSLVLSEDDLVFDDQDKSFRPLATIETSLISSGLTVVTRVMFTAECPTESCSVFQFGNLQNTNLMRLSIENEHIKLSIGNNVVPGPKIKYAKWYNVIVRVDYSSSQQHLFISDFNFSNIHDSANSINDANVAELEQTLSRNLLNDEHNQFNLHFGGFHVFRDFIQLGHAKQLVSGIRIGGTDVGVKDHGVQCTECPEGYTSLPQDASGIQQCFKHCLSGEFADTEGWRVIAQTYIPSQEPFVRHTKKPAFQFINDNFADFADATHVKYECTLGREGTKDNKISTYQRIFKFSDARQACGDKLHDCDDVSKTPFDFWTTSPNPAKFKLEINKVTCMIEDTDNRFDDPDFGMWGRVSVITHTDAEELLSVEGKSVCRICEFGKTSDEGQNKCREKNVAVSGDEKNIDHIWPTNWYQRFMAFPLESFTTEKFYTPPLSKEKLALKQHFDSVYSYFDHNLTHYYKMEEFSLVDDYFPTFQSARYEKTETDHKHFGFFGYKSSAVLVIDKEWLLAFAKLEKIDSQGKETGNFDPFLILRHAKTGKQAFQQISFADDFDGQQDIDLISDLVSFKGQYGFNYVAMAFRKQNCIGAKKCAFLQTTRILLDRDDPQLYFQHLHDMQTIQTNLKIVAVPDAGGKLVLFQNNLVAVMLPEDDSAVTPTWHDLTYTDGDTIVPWATDYDPTLSTGIKFTIFHKKVNDPSLVLAHDGVPPASVWKTVPEVLESGSDPRYYGIRSESDSKACFGEHAEQQREIILQIADEKTKRVWGVVTSGIPKFKLYSSEDGSIYDEIFCERRDSQQYCEAGTEETVNKLQFPVDATHVRLFLPEDASALCLRMGVYVHETWEHQDRVLFYEIERDKASPLSLDKNVDHSLLLAHRVLSQPGDFWIGYYEPDDTGNVSSHVFVTHDPTDLKGCDLICQDYNTDMQCSDELTWDFSKVLEDVFENQPRLSVLPKAGVKFKPSKNGMQFKPGTDRYVDMGNFVAFDPGYLTLAARIKIDPRAETKSKMYLVDLQQIDFHEIGLFRTISLYTEDRKLCVLISFSSENDHSFCNDKETLTQNFGSVILEINMNDSKLKLTLQVQGSAETSEIETSISSLSAHVFSAVIGRRNRYHLLDHERFGSTEKEFYGEISALYAWGQQLTTLEQERVFGFFRQEGVTALTGFLSDDIIEPKFRYDRDNHAGCIGCSSRQYYDIVGNGGLTIIAKVETESTNDRQTHQVMNTSNVLLKVEIGAAEDELQKSYETNATQYEFLFLDGDESSGSAKYMSSINAYIQFVLDSTSNYVKLDDDFILHDDKNNVRVCLCEARIIGSVQSCQDEGCQDATDTIFNNFHVYENDDFIRIELEQNVEIKTEIQVVYKYAKERWTLEMKAQGKAEGDVVYVRKTLHENVEYGKKTVVATWTPCPHFLLVTCESRSEHDFLEWNSQVTEKSNQCLDHRQCRGPFLFSGEIDEKTRSGPFVQPGHFGLMCYTDDQEKQRASFGYVRCDSDEYGLRIKLIDENNREILSDFVNMPESLAVTGAFSTADDQFSDAIRSVYVWDRAMNENDISIVRNTIRFDEQNNDIVIIGRTMKNGVVKCTQQGQAVKVKLHRQDQHIADTTFDLEFGVRAIHSEINTAEKKVFTLLTNGKLYEWYYEDITKNYTEPVLEDFTKYGGLLNGVSRSHTKFSLAAVDESGDVQDVILLDPVLFSNANKTEFFPPVKRFGHVFVAARDSIAVFDRSGGSLLWDVQPMSHRTDEGDMISSFAVSADGGTVYIIRRGGSGILESRTLRRWYKSCPANSDDDQDNLHRCKCLSGFYWDDSLLRARLSNVKTNEYTYDMWVDSKRFEDLLPAQYTIQEEVTPTCKPCPANTSSHRGAYNISGCVCKAGFEGENAEACLPCRVGKYKSEEGFHRCTSCPAGKFSRAVGANSSDVCQSCSLGFYQPDSGSTTCLECPSGTETLSEGTSDIRQCTCQNNFYGIPGARCVRCTKNNTEIIHDDETRQESFRTQCTCKQGYHPVQNGTMCEPCGAGRYQDGFGEKSFNRLDRLGAALTLDPVENSASESLDVNMTETGGFTILARIKVDKAWFMQRVFRLRVYLVDASWFEFELIQQQKFWEQDRNYFTVHVQDSTGVLLCKAEIPDDTITETTHSDEVMLRFDYVEKEISIVSHFHQEFNPCDQLMDMSSKISSYDIQFESDTDLPESQVSTEAFYLLDYLLQVEDGEGRGAFLAALKDEAINRQDLITVKQRKCEACPDNSHTETDFNLEATNCLCKPGYERAGADAEAPCVQCDKGKYKTGLNDTECIKCPEHMTSNVLGSTDHSKCYCVEGFFGVNDTSCQQCPKGKYGSRVNQTACLDCPAEFYQDETGKTTCKKCPENSITARNGSTSVNDCMCEAPYEYYLRYQSDIVFDSEAETNISALDFMETSAGFDVFFKIDNGVRENGIMHFHGGPNHTIEVDILPGNEKVALNFTSNRTSCIITLRDLTREHVEITLDQGKPGARSNVEKDYELCEDKNFTFQSYFRANEIEFERSSKAERLIVFKKIVPLEEKEHILRKVKRGRQSRLKLVNQTDFVFKIDTEKAENQVEGLELMVQRDGNDAVKEWATMVDYESVLAYEGSPPAWAWRYTNALQNPDTKNFGIWAWSSAIAFTSNFEVTLDLGQLRMATGIIFTEVDDLSVKKSTDGFLFDDVSVTEHCRKTEDNLCISPFAETQESRYVKVTSSGGSAQGFKMGVFVSQWFPVRSAEYNFISDEITLKVQIMDDYKPENTTVRATDHTRFLNVSTVKTCNVSSVTKDCFAYRRKERPSTWETNLQWASQYNARVPWEYELRSYLPSWNETDGNTFPVIPNKWAPVYKKTDDAVRFGLMQIGVGDDPDKSNRCKRNWDRIICSESRCDEEFDQQVTCDTCKRNDASLWRDDCSDNFMMHDSSYLETQCNLEDASCDQDDKLARQTGNDLWNEYEFFLQSVSTYKFTIQRNSQSFNITDLTFTDTLAEHCNQCPVGKFYYNQTKICQECEPGKYQDEVGRTYCNNCAAGKYQESAEKTACKNCAAGKYQTSLGSKNCTDCSTGKYSNRIGATSLGDCLYCTKGSYQNETGRTSCKNCGNNTTPDPTLLPPYTNISSCYCKRGHSREQECTALQQLVIYDQCSGKRDDSCKCESGTYKGQVAEGLNPCIPCFPGTYSGAGSIGVESCRQCRAGKREKNRLRCELCEDGKVSLDGWAQCKIEYPKQMEIRLQVVIDEACVYENTAEFQFDKSLTGKWFERKGEQCTMTHTRYMSVTFIQANCEKARTDFFGANSSMATSHKMLLHESLRRKDISCDALGLRDYISDLRPLGYKNEEWQLMSVMTRCDPNAEWKEGDCKCKPGWTGDGNFHVNHTCIACEAGKYKSDFGSSDCVRCPSGTYLEFKNATSETDCSLCAVGKYSELAAATSPLNCTNCHPGTYQDQPGSSKCRNCPAGTELNATGSVSLQNCSNCTAGHRSVAPGQATCSKCPSGKFMSFEGQTECTGCGLGKFSEEEGANSSSTCKKCLAGTFSNALGNSRCTPCAAGKYSELEGAKSDLVCIACAQGKYSQNESATSSSVCKACESGKHQPQTGQAQCIVCPRVDHIPDVSKTSCVKCESGKYAFSGDSNCTQSDQDIGGDGELWVKMEVEIEASVTDEDIYNTLLHLPWVQIYDDREFS